MTAPLPAELEGWKVVYGSDEARIVTLDKWGSVNRVIATVPTTDEAGFRLARFLRAAPVVAAELERMTALIESHLDEKGNWKARTP